ncbi:hypothetical protein ZOSMA_350G00030 [Zostera marina]|uniref:Bifunctional inhibitor/plant lipid transfer protein/seed storage helical domain-containing protein n=1 Tax=Zostera marina TaxID=29655 RepID=A0A0K9P6R3_ZOSMR|nr:hypothetical protein ZOSMA_350G00030 [Zostera marina]
MKNLFFTSLHFLTALIMTTTAKLSSAQITTTETIPIPIPLPRGCSSDLVTLSPCLSFIAESPNNVASNASSACCQSFAKGGRKIIDRLDSGCICHLVRDSKILGFPINSGRIFQLFDICTTSRINNGDGSEIGQLSVAFRSFCDG